jgi:hypothetical protein
MTINEYRDYSRWKSMRDNQEDSKRGIELYTQRELYLKDLDSSARDGFVSSASLDCFVDEINSVPRRKISDKIKRRLEEKSIRNTLENIYAMAQSASRVADTNSMNDFVKYKYEALNIAENYGNKKIVEDKFRELSMNALAEATAKDNYDFIELRNEFNGYKNKALKIAEDSGLDKKTIRNKFSEILRGY